MARANRQFVEDTKDKSGLKSYGRKVVESNDKFVLKNLMLLTMLI